MKSLGIGFAVLFLGTALLPGAESTRTGILIDTMCGETSASNLEKAADHVVSCALEADCRESGFGIVAEGRFFRFDAPGDARALEILEKTERESNLFVRVTGEFGEGSVQVSGIQEVE